MIAEYTLDAATRFDSSGVAVVRRSPPEKRLKHLRNLNHVAFTLEMAVLVVKDSSACSKQCSSPEVKHMKTKWSYVLATAALVGCAHTPTPNDEANLAHMYRTVESGQAEQLGDRRYALTRSSDGILIRRLYSQSTDNWIEKISDHSIQEGVRIVISADERLKGTPIQVHTDEGEVTLTGKVFSPTIAAAAIRDAMHVTGVVQVKANLALR